MLSSTRCVSTTPSDSSDASTPNKPVTYLVGRYGRREDSAAARNDSRNEGDDAASRFDESAAFDAPRSFLVPVAPPACVPLSGTLLPLPSAPQITSRIGKSFAQLLTSRAVLIAVGLAAVGGGRG